MRNLALRIYWFVITNQYVIAYDDPGEHFEHGSIGSETASGMPTLMFEALPVIYADRMAAGPCSSCRLRARRRPARPYHSGGLIAGEVPAILQKGERVIQRGGGMSGGDTTINLTVRVDGATGNSEVRSMVSAGVADGLRRADALLPDKVSGISRDPRNRGESTPPAGGAGFLVGVSGARMRHRIAGPTPGHSPPDDPASQEGAQPMSFFENPALGIGVLLVVAAIFIVRLAWRWSTKQRDYIVGQRLRKSEWQRDTAPPPVQNRETSHDGSPPRHLHYFPRPHQRAYGCTGGIGPKVEPQTIDSGL